MDLTEVLRDALSIEKSAITFDMEEDGSVGIDYKVGPIHYATASESIAELAQEIWYVVELARGDLAEAQERHK